MCHSILEDCATGLLEPEECAEEFERRYVTDITASYPPILRNYEQKAYAQALAYFKQFKGFGDNEIVSTEKPFELKIGSYWFRGISDLVMKNPQGELIVVDHKTKSPSSMKSDYALYLNQLYLYAEHCFREYGEYPRYLYFNMIKDPTATRIETFDIEQMKKTLKWTEETIDTIYMESEFLAKRAEEIASGGSDFYCRWICPVYDVCEEAQEAVAQGKK